MSKIQQIAFRYISMELHSPKTLGEYLGKKETHFHYVCIAGWKE